MPAGHRPGALILAFAALAFPAFADEPAPVAPAADKSAPAAEEPHAAPAKEAEALQGRLTLADGSVLSGTLRSRFVSAVSDTVGPFRLDLSAVESIDFSRQDGRGAHPQDPACRVTFQNGDRLTARLAPEKGVFALETLLGPLSVPIGSVASLVMEGQPGDALLYYCTFDNEAAITHPAAGPKGTFLGGEFVPGKVGNALRSWGDIPVAEVDLPKGTLRPKGTIEFWAKIESATPWTRYIDGRNPGFFGLWLFEDESNPGPCSTFLGFSSNNGMGMAGLCGMIYHRAMATDPEMRTNTYGPVLDDPAAWHHYAMLWDKDGLPNAKASDGTPAVAAIYLDGRFLMTYGRNNLARGAGLLALSKLQGKLAFSTPAAYWDSSTHHVPFLIDEFKIWSEPKVSVRP